MKRGGYANLSIGLIKGWWMLANGLFVDFKTHCFVNRLTKGRSKLTIKKIKNNLQSKGINIIDNGK